MQPNRHPFDDFIYHPAFCQLARSCDTREASPGQDRGHDESTARPSLRAALHLPPTPANIVTAYAAFVRKAVTVVTFAWRRRTRRARLDPAVGALRDTGLFVRPRELHGREDAAGDGESRLVPAAVVITNPSQN
jgi:hypothetical protein